MLTCNREAFSKAFHTVSSAAAGAKSDKPILSNVRVRWKENDTVTLYATDMDVFISCDVVCMEVKPRFDCLLNAAKFHSILSETKSENIEIESDENEIHVTCGSADFRIPTSNPQEFPVQAKVEGDWVTVAARGMRTAINRTQFCTDTASTRYQLGGVHYEKDAKETSLNFVGTDGRRLAHATIAADGESKLDGIIPMKAARAIMAICDQDGDCMLTADLNSVQVEVGGAVVISRLVEGRYPAWRKVMPDYKHYTLVPVHAGLLGSSIRQAAIVSDAETRGVDMTFTQGSIQFSAASAETGRSKVAIPVAYDGDPLAITVDFKFVGEFCKAVDPATIIDMMVGKPTEPAVLKAADYQYVIMPMARS